MTWSRRYVHFQRYAFFRRILRAVTEPPRRIDCIMGQSDFFCPADAGAAVIDVGMGSLVFPVHPTFNGTPYAFEYSIWQIGSMLKIGLLLSNGLEQAPLLDWHREVGDIWADRAPAKLDRAGVTVYEWTFEVPDLYSAWLAQERYVLGMRHCHFRILRIVRDFALLQNTDAKAMGCAPSLPRPAL